MPQDETPSIQVDSDWKAQAQAERDKLAQGEADQAEQAAPGGAGKLPPADFKGLVGLLASQAVMGLGAMPDPSGRGVVVDLDGAKFSIDLLAMLEEKTAGNLTEDESAELNAVVIELRARFVQITKMVAEQMTQGGPAAESKIVTPD